MITLVKSKKDGNWIIYKFIPFGSEVYGEIGVNVTDHSLKFVNIPEEIKNDASRACSGIRRMIEYHSELVDRYVYAWY